MRSTEATGKTKEEAVESALSQLNLKRSAVIVEVLEEGSRRFLGLGGKPVKVKVSEIEEGAANPAEVVNSILEMMGVEFTMDVERQDDETSIRIDAPKDDGLLIGRRGQTLDALRHISQRIIAARSGSNMIVNIDVGDYRARREDSLRERAREAAGEAREKKRNITLDPMSAQDRRVVHMELAEEEGLYTFTVGSGNRRRVVIAMEGEKGGGRQRSRPAQTQAPSEQPPVRDDEMAYDRVPDPGFKAAPISGQSERAAETEDGSERERGDRSRSSHRSDGERRPRSESRSGGRDGGNRRDRSDGRGGPEGRERQGGRDRDRGEGGDRRESRDSRAPRDRGDRPRRDRDDRPRREGGRDSGRGRRDGRDSGGRGDSYGNDRRDSYGDERRDSSVDNGPREKAVLSEVKNVGNDSKEKAFNSDLASRILQISKDKDSSDKGSRRSRRR